MVIMSILIILFGHSFDYQNKIIYLFEFSMCTAKIQTQGPWV